MNKSELDQLAENALTKMGIFEEQLSGKKFPAEEFEMFKTPGEILTMADRIECIIFSGYDPSFSGFEPPSL